MLGINRTSYAAVSTEEFLQMWTNLKELLQTQFRGELVHLTYWLTFCGYLYIKDLEVSETLWKPASFYVGVCFSCSGGSLLTDLMILSIWFMISVLQYGLCAIIFTTVTFWQRNVLEGWCCVWLLPSMWCLVRWSLFQGGVRCGGCVSVSLLGSTTVTELLSVFATVHARSVTLGERA